jgi:hypothetical protein
MRLAEASAVLQAQKSANDASSFHEKDQRNSTRETSISFECGIPRERPETTLQENPAFPVNAYKSNSQPVFHTFLRLTHELPFSRPEASIMTSQPAFQTFPWLTYELPFLQAQKRTERRPDVPRPGLQLQRDLESEVAVDLHSNTGKSRKAWVSRFSSRNF